MKGKTLLRLSLLFICLFSLAIAGALVLKSAATAAKDFDIVILNGRVSD